MKHINSYELRTGAKPFKLALTLLVIVLALAGVLLMPVALLATEAELKAIADFILGV